MLDVHPPHSPTHTWRDFLIHIATIVIGLIIAVGLEQTVEFIHHRREAHEARGMLGRELLENRDVLEINTFEVSLNEKNLHADLAVLRRLRAHSPAPGDRLLLIRPARIFSDVAWKDVTGTGAAAYLSEQEREDYGFAYLQQERFNVWSIEIRTALELATSVLYDETTPQAQSADQAGAFNGASTGSESLAVQAISAVTPSADLSHLTPVKLDRLEQGIQEAIAGDHRLLRNAANIQRTLDAVALDQQHPPPL